MKRILIIIPSFEIGGTIVSLHSLLGAIDPMRLSIDIFARKREGPYIGILENCHILDENYWLTETFSKSTRLSKLKITLIKSLKSICRILHIDIKSLCIKNGCKQLGTELYDAVVSYQENFTHEISRYPAKRRIAWIHSDYSRLLKLLRVENENSVYEDIDKVVCVSAYAKSVFDVIYPQYAWKSVAIHNVINVEGIIAKSMETEDLDPLFDTSVYTIVSVGRLDPVKQFEKIPIIAKQIKEISNNPFKWYIIGGSRGFDEVENELRLLISEYGLQDSVIRLSEKKNIYPYISKANLYVCTSLSESFPLVVNEAKALKVPVVSNNFPSVMESITVGIDGYVVKMKDMASKIVEMMRCVKKANQVNINNEAILEKIYDLFEVGNEE